MEKITVKGLIPRVYVNKNLVISEDEIKEVELTESIEGFIQGGSLEIVEDVEEKIPEQEPTFHDQLLAIKGIGHATAEKILEKAASFDELMQKLIDEDHDLDARTENILIEKLFNVDEEEE